MKTIRLGKLAGEENIGMSQIVAIFEILGISIEASPNTKLDEDKLNAFYAFRKLPEVSKDKLIEDYNARLRIQGSDLTTYEVLRSIRDSLGSPQTIFKYYSDNHNSIDSVLNNYLYYSSHKSFNDPFDCYNHLVDLKSIGNLNSGVFEKIRTELEQRLLNHGICCFSRINNSILMWSHYGNKHRGFCIEFDYKSIDSPPLDINYVHEFKRADLVNDSNALYHLIYTKSINWQYEMELRSFIKLEDQNRRVKYDADVIKAIYFGVNMELDLMKKIAIGIYEKNSKVKFFKGELDKEAFDIKWRKLNDSFLIK